MRTALIGAGMFGAGIVAQSVRVPALQVLAIADADLKAARIAFAGAGVTDPVECESRSAAFAAIERGWRVITTDAAILFDLPIDAVVEATGHAEAGARHASLAIEHGKHVAMVTKEADAAVGPILRHKAEQAGVGYMPVAGDQHGLLISLVAWARSVGLEVLCGGKMLDSELLLTLPPATISHYGKNLPFDSNLAKHFAPMTAVTAEAIAARGVALGDAGGAKPWDLAELVIAANATGLSPDIPATHCPAVWTTEIPGAMCPRDVGGLLSGRGVIDAVQILRQPHEAGLGGGVLIVVAIADESARQIFVGKGAICNARESAALIVHPQHLMGIEAIGTILNLPNEAKRTMDYCSRYDIVYVTRQPLSAGTVIGDDHSPAITAHLIPATRSNLPAGLAQRSCLTRDVVAGVVIDRTMVERPVDSVLWKLRDEQDAHFLA